MTRATAEDSTAVLVGGSLSLGVGQLLVIDWVAISVLSSVEPNLSTVQ